MKILLTGAQGQMGQAIKAVCKELPVNLLAFSHSQLDISQLNAAAVLIKKHKPNFIINAAAYRNVEKAELEPQKAFAVNVLGPEYLAKTCNKYNIPLIHFSTDYIFDGKKKKPYSETDIAAPLNIYGQTKYLGEKAIRRHLKQHIILRVSRIFSEYGQNFVKTMLNLMFSKSQIAVVVDQCGNPTYAYDIAKAILHIIADPSWGTFHYAGQPYITQYHFALAIYDQIKFLPKVRVQKIIAINSEQYSSSIKRPANSILDCEKFKNTYKLPLPHWQPALSHTIKLLLARRLY